MLKIVETPSGGFGIITVNDEKGPLYHIGKEGRGRPERLAAAQLVAAAPDLLDALTDLVGGCGKEGDLFSDRAITKARSAIEKAEGK